MFFKENNETKGFDWIANRRVSVTLTLFESKNLLLG
jgi:hypothetical protein